MRFISAILTAIFISGFVGCATSPREAAHDRNELLRKAQAGDMAAQEKLANAFDWGKDAPRDGNEAMKWYRVAAEQGSANAQNSVGSGLQAEKRFSEALPWYEKAAAQGHPLATNNLAYLYDMGLGTRQDRKKGYALYSRAAEMGWPESMWNIAIMYGAGQLGPKDLMMACVWTVRARRFAQPEERGLLDTSYRTLLSLKKSLTSMQFDECQRQGNDWSPTLVK